MNIIIPLGGIGIRFKKMGYKTPKPLIKVLGKEIICWLLDNLNIEYINDIIIPYNKELENYRFEDFLVKTYPTYSFRFICLDKQTEGAAETILTALQILNEYDLQHPVLCLDGDNFYNTDIISKYHNKLNKNCVFVFNDYSQLNCFSYIKIDGENDKIVDILEKEKVSNLACTGAYGFSNGELLRDYCQKIIFDKFKQKEEYYTSSVIKYMIKDNYSFVYDLINESDYNCLGTPIQIRIFCYNHQDIANSEFSIQPVRFCFDLDNTLVTFSREKGDYKNVKPIERNIEFLKYLKKMGNTIIIYTARRMRTHNGNIGKINSEVGKITFDTLDKFDIPYDELYFGKPYAHFYIDDLAISCFDDMEKETGFYLNETEPRSFNQISEKNLKLIRKESDNLLPEINYYLNIPKEIEDLFPTLINHDIQNKWYEIEKVNGINLSKLYISNEINNELFQSILNNLERIHNINYVKLVNHDNQGSHDSQDNQDNQDNLNIYQNYNKKLKNRFDSYDYSNFKNSKEIYDKISTYMENYEIERRGHISMIHGDPVFTNVLVNNYGKIKFIDMRGKVGDKLTLLGDKLYDYAKVYQSLVGYDEILCGKVCDIIIKNNLIDYYEQYIIRTYSQQTLQDIKYITASLLFSLIPLHHNNKCQMYYNLIFNLI